LGLDKFAFDFLSYTVKKELSGLLKQNIVVSFPGTVYFKVLSSLTDVGVGRVAETAACLTTFLHAIYGFP